MRKLAKALAQFTPLPVIVPPVELIVEEKRRLLIKMALQRLLDGLKEEQEQELKGQKSDD